MTELEIAIRNLTIRYGRTVVLEIDSLDLIGPAFVALVGPNGAGKSTLLKTVAGLRRPSSGTVTVGGAEAISLEAQRRAAYIPDRPVLFNDLTIRDNIAFVAGDGSDEVRDAASGLVQRFGIAHLLDRFPPQLSLGQRQITSLLVGLAPPTPVLLVDEPTLALDAERSQKLCEQLRDEANHRLVIISTHEQNIISAADIVIRLNEHGRLDAE